jgi:peptidoglycan/LPS O-acetylase OafA/YrhL
MIQRKQSIFLGLIMIFSVLLFIFPTVTYTAGDVTVNYAFSPFDVHASTSPIIYGLFASNCGLFITSFMCLMLFHNRKKQIKVSRIVMLMAAVMITLVLVFPLYKSETAVRSFSWPIALPALSIVCAFLAGHFIKKDEELVRSANRVR